MVSLRGFVLHEDMMDLNLVTLQMGGALLTLVGLATRACLLACKHEIRHGALLPLCKSAPERASPLLREDGQAG